MAFNFRACFQFTRSLLSTFGDPTFGWTPRRAGIMIALFLFYPLLEVFIWFHLLLDDLLFRRYRQIDVESPVFIVGNFRSGTTFLHRLMAKDTQRFSTMKMWEILFAPSILQRKVIGLLGAVDRRLGGPIDRRLAGVDDQWEEQNVMHKAALREPEEDDYLLLHIWSALTIGLSSGLLEAAAPYTRFDTALPQVERDRIMAFYRRCLQRHLYAHQGTGQRQYLAKNPALTPKLDSVYRRFPDAKVLCLVRSPLEAVPSFVNMMNFSWRVAGGPDDSDDLREFIVDMAGHWYRYPLERLEGAPEDSYVLVRYDDLVDDPQGTVEGIYRRFGFEMTAEYASLLKAEADRARRYRSRHAYSLSGTGLSRERILIEFGDVFERFGFDTGEPSAPEDAPGVLEREAAEPA